MIKRIIIKALNGISVLGYALIIFDGFDKGVVHASICFLGLLVISYLYIEVLPKLEDD